LTCAGFCRLFSPGVQFINQRDGPKARSRDVLLIAA
jgi:hypothetical protein